MSWLVVVWCFLGDCWFEMLDMQMCVPLIARGAPRGPADGNVLNGGWHVAGMLVPV
jgi:hypothetical protein